MATNLGGLPTECYICCRKPRKLQAISLRRFGALLSLVRFAQPAEVRLRSALVPPFAQNDIQNFCFVVIVRMDDLMEGGKPPRDCKQSLRPTMNFNVFVGACNARPPLLLKPFVFGMPRTSSPTTDFKIHRRGDSRIAHSLFAICVRFRTVEDAGPYKISFQLCTLHSALLALCALLVLFRFLEYLIYFFIYKIPNTPLTKGLFLCIIK